MNNQKSLNHSFLNFLSFHSSQLTVYYSLFLQFFRSQFTVYSLRLSRLSQFTVYYSLFLQFFRSLFTAHSSQFTVHSSRLSQFTVYYSLFLQFFRSLFTVYSLRLTTFSIATLLLTLTLSGVATSQIETRVGEFETKKVGQNYFNYSDPEKINIEVIVLGGVKSPGKYLVPEGTTFLDIMSLTGGLINDRIGDNIKFIRPSEKNGKLKDDKVILLKYADLYKDDAVSVVDKINPVLQPGDVIAVPIKPEMTTWESIKDVLVIITPLVSIGTLIVSILNYTK